ncbi:hypothetical protein VSH64_29985 [Amycolatopsis rhabdoformis]|uniref:OmpA family protein n=1 Tax=Amycolatopsis rhabdoformis TaxID=1448059 RepID=A0ABZ1HZ14_9PSEU|nr:hypothetical protein [Amycolatopsis rhabdoformis]WSE27084.1 hypothetical protein VSH64_29985 [Amycolatopsis rhabdoformis]
MTVFAGLAEELTLAEAADLARLGQYAAAVELLQREATDDVARLDLLARVHAQTGELDLADAAWARVLELAPESEPALAGRRLIAKIRAGRLRKRPVGRRLAVAGAAVVVVAGVAAIVLTLPWSSPAPASVAAPAATTSPAVQAELDRLHASQSQAAQAEQSRQAKLTALASRLGGDGVQVATGSAVTITFDEGLFGPNAISPSTAGRRALEQWGAVLKGLDGQAVRVTVIGHGVAVPGGPTTGGSSTALARAASAARVLATASGLPLTTFAITSADQATPVHEGTDAAANRSVTLEVTPG